jgi:hypothetical protein
MTSASAAVVTTFNVSPCYSGVASDIWRVFSSVWLGGQMAQ